MNSRSETDPALRALREAAMSLIDFWETEGEVLPHHVINLRTALANEPSFALAAAAEAAPRTWTEVAGGGSEPLPPDPAEAAPLDVERLAEAAHPHLLGSHGHSWAECDSQPWVRLEVQTMLDTYAALRSPDTETAGEAG